MNNELEGKSSNDTQVKGKGHPMTSLCRHRGGGGGVAQTHS